MRFLRSAVFGRFKTIGLLSDLAMVGAAAFRVAKRPGGGRRRSNPAQWLVVGGAALRLLRRIRRVRRRRRASGVG
ncbi:MAG: hypothetical protein ACFCVK_05545 [Acidimicrobiales bacterium]